MFLFSFWLLYRILFQRTGKFKNRLEVETFGVSSDLVTSPSLTSNGYTDCMSKGSVPTIFNNNHLKLNANQVIQLIDASEIKFKSSDTIGWWKCIHPIKLAKAFVILVTSFLEKILWQKLGFRISFILLFIILPSAMGCKTLHGRWGVQFNI